MNKKNKISYYLNLSIFILVVFSVLWMMSGFTFKGQPVAFSAARFASFKFFTVDSNALMGIIALIMFIYQGKYIKGKIDKIPFWVRALYLMGATGVTLTMLVTMGFLAPKAVNGYFSLFTNSNFFMHFFVPFLVILNMVVFDENHGLKFKHVILGTVPMFMYAVVYLINALSHVENNKVSGEYDWYGFLAGGANTVYIVFPLIIVVTFLISLGLWKGNRMFKK